MLVLLTEDKPGLRYRNTKVRLVLELKVEANGD